ncbi:hypothetical protein [Hydrogenophilus thiooxidans]|uniref:hypothetical protein n=1 Tax=Hydrogenophilus thiooxidans TaxID=2820326 RepID=UPI001C234AD5|nr:hypothetical protein [Hydrogenophilus thiooxidans]
MTPPTSPWLRRLPGSRKAPAGLEWKIFKRLPRWFAGGLLACALPPLIARWWYADLGPAAEKYLNTVDILTLAALVLHVTIVFTVGFGCLVVIIMKGHGYVADGIEVPSSREDDLADLRAREALKRDASPHKSRNGR